MNINTKEYEFNLRDANTNAAVLEDACRQSRLEDCIITLMLEGIHFEIYPTTTIENAKQIFEVGRAKNREDDKDDYVKIDKIAKRKLEACQKRIPQLLSRLPDLLSSCSTFELMEWFRDFVDHQHADVDYDQQGMAVTLSRSGYISNANTGDGFDKTDAENIARCIVGHIVDCLERKQAFPENAANRFIKKWFRDFGKDSQ